MGNSRMPHEDWPVVSQQLHFRTRKSHSGLLVQEHSRSFLLDSEAQIFRNSCIQRQSSFHNSKHVVRLLSVSFPVSESHCGSASSRLVVLTQSVDYLFDLKQVAESQMCRLLSEAAEGLRQLCMVFGPYFYLTERMLGAEGFGSEFTAKIWHNQNFSQLLPQYTSSRDASQTEAEHKLLTCLLEIGERVFNGKQFGYVIKEQRKFLPQPYSVSVVSSFFTKLSRLETSSVRSVASGRHTVVGKSPRVEDVTELKSFYCGARTSECMSAKDELESIKSDFGPANYRFRRHLISATDFIR